MKSYYTAWATMLIRQYLAPDGYVVSLQNCMNEETIAGVVGWARRSAVSRRASRSTCPSPASFIAAPPNTARRIPFFAPVHGRVTQTRGGSMPSRRPCRQRQGDQQSVGRALVETRRQCHAEWDFRLHRPAGWRNAQKRSDSPFFTRVGRVPLARVPVESTAQA